MLLGWDRNLRCATGGDAACIEVLKGSNTVHVRGDYP